MFIRRYSLTSSAAHAFIQIADPIMCHTNGKAFLKRWRRLKRVPKNLKDLILKVLSFFIYKLLNEKVDESHLNLTQHLNTLQTCLD